MTAAAPRTVCFFAIATHLGGAERSLLELVRSLRAKPECGYQPWVVLPKAEGPLVDRLREADVSFSVLPMPQSFFEMSRGAPLVAFQKGVSSVPGMGFYLRKLVRLLEEKKPVLIHTTGIKCHALAALVGPVAGIPVIWHLRDILKEGPSLWTLRVMRKAASVRVIANSRATADAFSKDDAKIQVIHNGLDPAVYSPRPNRQFNEQLRVPAETPIVGIVGVLARWKGQMLFLKMAHRLLDQGMSARFVVVGDEIYDTVGESGFAHSLKEEAARLGIADRVLFTGFRENVAEAVNGLDVLVHASTKPEPFGRVILEAMACGVPVVASAAGGVLEFVEDGRTGLLFSPGSVGELSNAVGRLLADKRFRSSMAAQAREEFLLKLTSDRHRDAMVSVYDEVTSA